MNLSKRGWLGEDNLIEQWREKICEVKCSAKIYSCTVSQLVRQGYSEKPWLLTLPSFKTTHVHKWLQKQAHFFTGQGLLMRNTFRMKHSGLNLVWQFYFGVCQKSTWQMEENGIELLYCKSFSSQCLRSGHFFNALCQKSCRGMFLDWAEA